MGVLFLSVTLMFSLWVAVLEELALPSFLEEQELPGTPRGPRKLWCGSVCGLLQVKEGVLHFFMLLEPINYPFRAPLAPADPGWL